MRHVDLRQRLLRAAEQEIMANGLARTSLRGIARRVGVSHQATAHHFDDRAGLFTALAIEGFDTLTERTREAMASVSEPGARQVGMAYRAYVEFARRHPTMFDVMFRPELLHAEDPHLAEARLEHRRVVTEAIAAAQDAGWGGLGISADEVATLGWATVHGLAVLQRDSQLSDAYPDLDVEALLDRVSHALGALGQA